MSFNTALTSGQLESLRGTSAVPPSHSGRLYVSACPNTVVYTANVNQITFGTSFASFTYDTGSGTLANVRVGMTIMVSHTSSIYDAFWVGRIRLAPSSTVFYINETSAPVADNDYVFVLDDYRIWDKLARFVSPTLYLDYDLAFRQLLPRIYNLQSAYVVMTDGADGEFDFAPSVAASTSGATISTYLWAVGDGTITAGSSSTKDITATFPPGFRWIHFTATDSGSRATTRHIPIFVHDPDNMPVPLEIGDFDWTASIEEGFSASVPAFDGIDTILDNTFVVAWIDAERYNGTLETIVSNIVMLGRLRTEISTTAFDDVGQQDASTRFDIEGPLQTLGRLEVNPVEMLSQTSPDAWCEIKDCTPWREAFLVLSEFSTFHELHSIDFDSTDTTFADLGVTVPLGSLLNAVNSILFSINAQLQMNGSGECEGVRDANLIPTASRSSLITVAGWTTADIMSIDYQHDQVNIVGRSLASGGAYNTTSKKLTVVNSIAPGIAQDYPEGSTSLDRQVLTANQNKAQAAAELNIRNGHWFARAQDFDTMTVDHMDGYWWLTPAQNQWYTFTLDGTETARGTIFTSSTRWFLSGVTGHYSLQDATFDIQCVYKRETSGTAGQTIVYPPQPITPITVPDFPPLPPFPAFDIGDFFLPDDIVDSIVPAPLAGTLTTALKRDGNTVMVWTASGVWMCSDFLTRLTPTWVEITPPIEENETIVQCRFAPGGGPSVIVSTSKGDTSTTTYDFTASDGTWTAPDYPGTSWSAAGWGNSTNSTVGIHRVFSGYISKIDINISGAMPGNYAGVFWAINGQIVLGQQDYYIEHAAGTFFSYSFPTTLASTIEVLIQDTTPAAGSPNPRTITSVVVTNVGGGRVWTSDDPTNAASWEVGETIAAPPTLMRIGETFDDIFLFDNIANEVYYSDDRGVTFGSAISVGTAPTAPGGFDTGRLGTVTMGPADGQIRIATTQGGAYADYRATPTDTEGTCIFIPRYKFSAANNGIGVSAPDFIFASDIPASGTNNGLFKVTAGGATLTNITPVDSGADKGLAVSHNCLAIPWYSSAYQDILGILDFDGVRKFVVSDDAGTTWVISGALNADANFITTRRSDTQRRQVFLTNGPNAVYSSSYRSDPPLLATRIGPNADTLIGIEVLP